MGNNLQLNATNEDLGDILSNGKKYIVPKFQRDYSWENEHWEILWEDIERILQNKKEYR